MIVDDLEKRLNIEKLPVYFLEGADGFLRNKAIEYFVKLVSDDLSIFNLQIFDDVEVMNDVISACNMMPVMDNSKVVIVRSTSKLSDSDKAQLISYLKKPADFTTLVLSDDSSPSVLNQLYKYGEVVDCKGCSEAQILKWVKEVAQSRNIDIDDKAILLLSKFTDCNMMRVLKEVEKLVAYCDGKKITVNEVELLVTPDNEYSIFKLTDALKDGNNFEALTVLNSMLSKGTKPSVIISTLSGNYRRMFEAKVSSLDVNELAKVLGVKPYAITLARKQAEKYTQIELKKFNDTLHELEFLFKSGQTDEREALQRAMLMLIKK
ncbi:MAG: DNA polymerase III subunit delta [Clostridia bacterium]